MEIRDQIRRIIRESIDGLSNRRVVKVNFEDGDSITTPINGTEQEIEDHYIGNYFDLGNGEQEKMVKAISVEYLS